ncbi:hypothetical protein EMIHUDRAFT_106669 [Emiliania huxleyi CCMP1516]|uniref:Thioredoxin domain-containing protein n=2 Tax=Emiliania huxleyi TaxID=2903 RepID=A0A0D3I6W4_EMIH1|nr:hypothetical protein EMIHUDRAFT_106669 [Emiliania huxleyi CCMP1516]EOD06999.1 hypothetical protein EMIHUDRAFT_106669 [Emiliania huxleyi CCMP1516]|eukprot:XP_005759428.1 hypothetical protein EMIHUDRAFT_106669 [Emiliania huxleyi CCMP1516]
MPREIRSLRELLEVATSSLPRVVVVDFYAQWCGPCKLVAPHFEQMAATFSDVALFVKVDVDVAEDVRDFAGVRAMPTFHVYRGAERVFELVGANLPKLEAFLARHRSNRPAQSAAPALPALPPPAPAPTAPPPAAAGASSAPPGAGLVPVRVLMKFDDGKAAAIKRKLLEVSGALRGEGHAAALPEQRERALARLCDSVAANAGGDSGEGDNAGEGDTGGVEDGISAAVLRHAASPCWDAWADAASVGEGRGGAGASEAPGAGGSEGGEAGTLARAHESERPATRLALATLLLNAAVLLRRSAASSDTKTPAICALQQLLTAPALATAPAVAAAAAEEASCRAALALGTLAHGDVETQALCAGLDLPSALDGVGGGGASARQRECVASARAALVGC